MQRKSKGVARNCGEEQGQSIAKQRMSIAPMSEGIAEYSVAVFSKGIARKCKGVARNCGEEQGHSPVEQSEKWQGQGKEKRCRA